MSNVEKKGHVSPNWPVTDRDHAVTEIVAPFTGPSSPWGDDKEFPVSADNP